MASVMGERRVTQSALTAALFRRRERLLALAPVFLTAEKRVDLVDGLFDPQKPAGMMAKMICIVLAEAITAGDI